MGTSGHDETLLVPPNADWVHLCLDMHKIFGPEGVWPTPWMQRVLPNVVRIAERHPDRTIFTKFVTPERAEDARGAWRTYYEKWRTATREHLDAALLDLMPPLQDLCPPATVIPKHAYSAFHHTDLDLRLAHRGATGLIITGSETDVCVLSTVLAAIDHGYPVALIDDALCSSSDEGHDKLIDIYHRRYNSQVRTLKTDELLAIW